MRDPGDRGEQRQPSSSKVSKLTGLPPPVGVPDTEFKGLSALPSCECLRALAQALPDFANMCLVILGNSYQHEHVIIPLFHVHCFI